MIRLKIIRFLLEYPTDDLWANQAELFLALETEASVIKKERETLVQFMQSYFAQDLSDAQEHYLNCFDRGRATSLLLFEHVYGQSRERGQAMVDLLWEYEKVGLQLNCKELPDFLPLYLEYLSVLTLDAQKQGIRDIAAILLLIKTRLDKRTDDYAVLFSLLLAFVDDLQLDSDAIKQQIEKECDDQSLLALDAVWQEECVDFFKRQGCFSEQEQQRQQQAAMRIMPQYLDIHPHKSGGNHELS